MSESSQDHLKEIEVKLSAIEQKIGSKWTMPIVVAVITGLIGMATVAIQIKLQADQDRESKLNDLVLASQEEARKERKEFHTKMQSLALEVRKHFRGQCAGGTSADDKLNAALENFRDLAELNRIKNGDDFTNNLQSYGEFVAEGLFDPTRPNCGQDDLKFQAVAQALNDFHDRRCILRIEEEAQHLGFSSKLSYSLQ